MSQRTNGVLIFLYFSAAGDAAGGADVPLPGVLLRAEGGGAGGDDGGDDGGGEGRRRGCGGGDAAGGGEVRGDADDGGAAGGGGDGEGRGGGVALRPAGAPASRVRRGAAARGGGPAVPITLPTRGAAAGTLHVSSAIYVVLLLLPD